MNLIFTRLGVTMLFLFAFTGMYAQQANAVVINAPADIAGVYRVAQPNPVWGPGLDGSITAPATFVIDSEGNPRNACEGGIENVQDKIAFIDRGDCSFLDKVVNAQSGGAVAAVICNNADVHAIQNMGPDDDGVITIPTFGMSKNDCNQIRMNLLDVDLQDVTLTYSCEPLTDPTVIWGDQPGQGDFSNGLGDWRVVNSSGSDTSWYWTIDSQVRGFFSTNTNVVEGSACNGFMAFSSDFYDNRGEEDPATGSADFGSGLCPNNGFDGIFCSGSIISPEIDMSGVTVENLALRLYHDWGYFYAGNTSLITSYDGGVSWPDTNHITLGAFPLGRNPEIFPIDGCDLQTEDINERGEGIFTVPISGYDGQESIVLQIKHNGGYYHATVDDIQLIDAGNSTDIEVLTSFVGRNPATAIPLSQSAPIPFHVDIINQGVSTVDDVMIQAEVVDPNGDTEFSVVNSNFMAQPSRCFLNENSTFPEVFTATQLGNYRATYRNITPNDQVEANDTVSFTWEMTQDLWRSVDKPAPDAENQHRQIFTGLVSDDPGEAGWCGFDWALAYNFFLPNGDGQFMTDVRFGVNFRGENSGDIKAYLYEWDPTAASLDPDGDPATGGWIVASEDLVLVGAMGNNGFGGLENSRPMTSLLGDQSDIMITMAAVNPADGQPLVEGGELVPLALKDNQHYSLVFVMNPDAGADGELDFIANNARAGSAYDYSATNFAYEVLGREERYGARTVCNLVDGGNFSTELFALTYGNGVANEPWIEMTITDNPSDTEDLLDVSENSLEVFPNPASEVLIIDLDLVQTSREVSFELMNLNGQLVKRTVHDNVSTGRFNMTVADLPSGVYTLNARSEAGFISKKVVITK